MPALFLHIYLIMKGIFRSLKTAALFVGSVVGAGFATGQEVQLFFGKEGVTSLVIASLFMAFCAFVFMDMGAKRVIGNPKVAVATDTVITLSSFAVYAAMIAAAEGVLEGLTGYAGLSALLAVAVMFLAGKRIGWVSGLNLIAVPCMAVIIILIGARTGSHQGGSAIHPVRALAYGGMNLLFSGALMVKEGETMRLSERVAASVIAGGLILPMLFFMWRCVAGNPPAEMPFLEVASREGLGTPASFLLLLAILTTMASCAYLVNERVASLAGDRTFAAPLVTLLGILTASAGFAPIVRTTYPIVSYLGLAATLIALFIVLRNTFSLLRKRKRRVSAP